MRWVRARVSDGTGADASASIGAGHCGIWLASAIFERGGDEGKAFVAFPCIEYRLRRGILRFAQNDRLRGIAVPRFFGYPVIWIVQ
jgi:hypothetical protein